MRRGVQRSLCSQSASLVGGAGGVSSVRFQSSSSSNNNNTTGGASSVSSSSSVRDRDVALQEEAVAKGFMKRQDFDSHLWMQRSFAQAETLPSGIKVYNLPPAPVPEGINEFDMYRKSTTDFTSLVDANKSVGVGLGAGFGNRPDKRLSWLRPRKDHLTPLPPEEQQKQLLDRVEREGALDLPEAKTPQERREQIERMLKYVKSFEGTAMSKDEHFLLADLDFEKDSLLFGSTRDDFIRNVDKLKTVISQYTRWERTDNAYWVGTIALKIVCAWLIIDSIQTYMRFEILKGNLQEFTAMTHEEIETLQHKYRLDLELVKQELEVHPPDFTPVVETIRAERRKRQAEEAAAVALRQQEGQTLNNVLSAVAAVGVPSVGSDVVAPPALSQKEMEEAHPMDTTFEQALKRKNAETERRREMERFAKENNAESGEGSTKKRGRSTWGYLKSYWHRAEEAKHEDSSGSLVEPLSAADFATFSYAAAPTSIATVRAIRRVLLPRSEDFTQIVREEMLEYKRKKDASTEYQT